jgi:hypothetical protein
MEQSRRSSEKEKLALQRAQEALALKEASVTEAANATSREEYMLQLMNDSSLDMAGILPEFDLFQFFVMLVFHLSLLFPLGRFFSGYGCRRSTR